MGKPSALKKFFVPSNPTKPAILFLPSEAAITDIFDPKGPGVIIVTDVNLYEAVLKAATQAVAIGKAGVREERFI